MNTSPSTTSLSLRSRIYATLAMGALIILGASMIIKGDHSNAQISIPTVQAPIEAPQPIGYQFIEPTIITDSGFSAGTCPQSTYTIDGATLLVPVNKKDSIGDYVPPNLVEIQSKIRTTDNKKVCLEETTAYYLKQMFDAAKTEGLTLEVMSGYRSPSKQLGLYNEAIGENGYDGTLRVAPPYHSEHHINAVDITAPIITKSGGNFGNTPEGRWTIEHAYEYGFVMSYPAGKEHITGYQNEDWHWRFIGKENATLVKDSGLTFHEIATDPTTRILPNIKNKIPR